MGRPFRIDRRATLAGAFALCGCSRQGGSADARALTQRGPAPLLRELASFPVGTCLSTAELGDAAYTRLVARQCSQIVPSWQLQMDAVIQPNGGFDFSQADAITSFARDNGQSLHATSLLWHEQSPRALQALDNSGAPFQHAVWNYVTAAVGRYRGQAASWDSVNEPVRPDGSGLRDCLWSRNLGAEGYMLDAFTWARAADPQAILVLNEFDLETPAKRRTFLQLAERLLRQGAPLGALGTQQHLDMTTDPASLKPAMRDLASLGLPIRVSELDVSTTGQGAGLMSADARLQRQAHLYAQSAQAFLDLPAHQRLAFCVWGLDDKRSWLRYRGGGGDASDAPLPFDDADRPKPAFWALADTFAHG